MSFVFASHRTDERQIEHIADHRYASDEGDDDRKKTGKEDEKAVKLDQHANHWPAEENNHDPAEKGGGAFHLDRVARLPKELCRPPDADE